MGGGAGEVAMDNRGSFKIYPRIDQVYTHKTSFNYDLMRAKVFRFRKENYSANFMHWLAFVIVGTFMGFTASIIVFIEDSLTEFMRDTT